MFQLMMEKYIVRNNLSDKPKTDPVINHDPVTAAKQELLQEMVVMYRLSVTERQALENLLDKLDRKETKLFSKVVRVANKVIHLW